MLAGSRTEAIETGVRAERMAAELGLDAVRADVLATIGTARGDMGDPRGDADLELAIELAEAATAPLALSRALNNLSFRAGTFDLRRSHALMVRNYETMQRYGHVGQIWWARGQLADTAFETGRWDEALEHADAVIGYVEAGTPHYFEGGCRLVRAAIAYARADNHTFEADIERALALAEKATDAQAKAPHFVYVAYLLQWAHDRSRARQLLDSALDIARTSEIGMGLVDYEASFAAVLLGLNPRELGVPLPSVTETPRQRATAALLDGDLVRTLDALVELGKVNDEAYLRLSVGQVMLGEGRTDEGVTQIEHALAFYRSVRATRFVAEGERLLEGSRQRSA
jgi:tetratricopeptide (TPR) repeat protein